MDAPLHRAITAVTLLETTVLLMAQTAVLVAETGDEEELERRADHTAACIARPRQTRVLARDFLDLAARDARRRVGHDQRLSREQFARALDLVGAFRARAAAHFPEEAAA